MRMARSDTPVAQSIRDASTRPGTHTVRAAPSPLTQFKNEEGYASREEN